MSESAATASPQDLLALVRWNKTDNRLENLEIVTGSRHQTMHRSGITDERVAELIRTGKTSRQIAALGVGTHRIVRVRQSLKVSV